MLTFGARSQEMMKRSYPLYQTTIFLAALVLTMPANSAPLPGGGGGSQDNCANAVPVMLGSGGTITLTGNNSAATGNGDFHPDSPFLGASAVWHAFTITECMNVTYGYCGQTPVWQDTWGFLWTSCPALLPTGPNAFNTSDCPDGNTTYEHWDLPPGTYYIGVPFISGSTGAYTITLTGEACPSGAVNDLCVNVSPVTLTTGTTLQFSGDNSGATSTNDFVPGDLSAAPVVWHSITTFNCNNIIVSYCGTVPAWPNALGLLLRTCPGDPDDAAALSYFNTTDCPDGNITYGFNMVPTGTYYIPVLRDDFTGSSGEYSLTVTATSCGIPDNDLCGSVTPVPLPVGTTLQLIGDNTGATDTGDFVAGHPYTAPVAWHAITLTGCSDVTVAYCGQDPVWENTFGILLTTCPGDEVISFSSASADSCGDGNLSYTFIDLMAGTYYVPVLNDPLANSSGPYNISVTAVDCTSIGIATVDGMNWSLFPNPAAGTFTLNNGGDELITSVEVVDMSGRNVLSSGARIAPGANAVFSDLDLSTGMYIVRVLTAAQERFEQRLIVH